MRRPHRALAVFHETNNVLKHNENVQKLGTHDTAIDSSSNEYLSQEHLARVLQVIADLHYKAVKMSHQQLHFAEVWQGDSKLTKEGNGLPTVQETVVVRESDDHDGADDDLAVDDDGALLDGVHAWRLFSIEVIVVCNILLTQDSGLWQVDYGSAVEGSEDTAVGTTSHRSVCRMH